MGDNVQSLPPKISEIAKNETRDLNNERTDYNENHQSNSVNNILPSKNDATMEIQYNSKGITDHILLDPKFEIEIPRKFIRMEGDKVFFKLAPYSQHSCSQKSPDETAKFHESKNKNKNVKEVNLSRNEG